LPARCGSSLQRNDAGVWLCEYPGLSFQRSPVCAYSLVSSLLLSGATMSQQSSLTQSAHSVRQVLTAYTAVAAKRVELLREMVPTAGSIALLVNPANPAFANPEAKQVQEAVRVLGLKLLVVNASTPSEIDAAFATMVQQQIGALVGGGEAFCISRTA